MATSGSGSSELSINETDPLLSHEGDKVIVSTRSRRVRMVTVLCILVTELCERLTFYGVAANLVLYCQDILKLKAPYPSTITLAFQGKNIDLLFGLLCFALICLLALFSFSFLYSALSMFCSSLIACFFPFASILTP
jgi:hypothetical protein